MRRRSHGGFPTLLLILTLGSVPACGKRADPLAPYLKTPQPPSGVEISQVGNWIEVRVTAPRTTTENRPLPVIELEWLQAPSTGDFEKLSTTLLREEAAPGELRIKRFARPSSDARFSVRAYSGKARSNPAPPLPYKVAAVPPGPGGLEATNTPAGVVLTWTNPPGAEPWPSPTPAPSPSPSPSPSRQPSPAAGPVASSSPRPAASDLAPPAEPPASIPATETPSLAPIAPPSTLPSSAPVTSPSPSPTPTPPLALPTGIRIFRTDGTPRPAGEPLQAASWVDISPKFGEKPCYSLRYATSFKPLVESVPTDSVCVEVTDLVPPEPPGRLLGDIGAEFVELSWLASTSSDVDYYRVYRTTEWEGRAMVTQTEGLLLRVRDSRMTPGPRTYEITAVDKGGNESPPGPPLQIVIP